MAAAAYHPNGMNTDRTWSKTSKPMNLRMCMNIAGSFLSVFVILGAEVILTLSEFIGVIRAHPVGEHILQDVICIEESITDTVKKLLSRRHAVHILSFSLAVDVGC
jgi:hypothetical protein